jgi:hypothetical protein
MTMYHSGVLLSRMVMICYSQVASRQSTLRVASRVPATLGLSLGPFSGNPGTLACIPCDMASRSISACIAPHLHTLVKSRVLSGQSKQSTLQSHHCSSSPPPPLYIYPSTAITISLGLPASPRRQDNS